MKNRGWIPVMLVIPALAHAGSAVSCQTVLQEANEFREIQVTKIVTLGDADGPGFLGEPGDVERRLNGEWVVTDLSNQSEVKFFSPSGEWLRTIGREGDGPGEYAWAWLVQSLPDDGLAIIDPLKYRLTTLSPDLSVRATLTFPIPPSTAVFMGSQGLVIGARMNGPLQVGFPVHLVDTSGVLVRSFGAAPPIQDWDNPDKVRRSLAPSGPNAIWTGKKTEYTLERWTLSGERTEHFIREVPWFLPHHDYGLPRDRSLPPGPGILAIREAEDGLLWVAIRVPDEHWEDAFETRVDPYGRDRPTIKDWNLYYDTMLEVVDPGTGTVLASTRLSPAFWGLTQEGHLFSHVYQEDLIPVVEVWEAQFHSPLLKVP